MGYSRQMYRICRKAFFGVVVIFLVLWGGSDVSRAAINIKGLDVRGCIPGGKHPCLKCTDCCSVGSVGSISLDEFNTYRKDFLMSSFYTDTVKPTFENLSDDVRNAVLSQVAVVGAFLDGSVFNDTLRDLDAENAKSLRSYTPSEQICRFGTLTRSLSASDARVDLNRMMLSKVGLSRNLGTVSSVASAGRGLDTQFRLKTFVEQFCDLKDNGSGLRGLCQVATAVEDVGFNRDVDYTRLLDQGPTINADLTNANWTKDETNVIMLGHFLYGHLQQKKRISGSELENTPGRSQLYREYRSVFARRAAAQNSYNTLAAMKMAGSGASDQYMKEILAQIGIANGDELKYLGAKNASEAEVKSSYNAQMNLLTKQIFQDPSFYANLMDSRANVKRTSAAIQGIGLMQDRDIYKSMERSEMLLAILVELEARKHVFTNQGGANQ